jgi:cyclase
MQEERVAPDIHVFTSELYAQVTASLIVTDEGCILIDTLPFPEETAQILASAGNLCRGGVRLLVLTHYHSDHVYGAYQFPHATIVAHSLTRQILIEKGLDVLEEAKSQSPELEEVRLMLPTVVFDNDELSLHLGNKTLQLFHSPGHTPDSIAAYVVEDRVLFAADSMMPVPTIFDGDIDALTTSLNRLKEIPIDSVVQGHGEVILRGEVIARIDEALGYLDQIRDIVNKAVAAGEPRVSLLEHDIESCGLSRIPLNGQVQQLHVTNLVALYDSLKGKQDRVKA